MSANEFELGDAIRAFLNEAGIRQKMKIEAAIADWGRIMGLTIASKTQKIWFKEGVLHVQISDPSWKTELSFSKTQIRDKMNQDMGEDIVEDVKIH